jgi:putative DNA methylase
MEWDYAETNVVSGIVDIGTAVGWVANAVEGLPTLPPGRVWQLDAATALPVTGGPACIATDPPYYDNIGYADLSDFFYVWLRQMLSDEMADWFSTLLTPKAEELIAAPYRFDGDNDAAKRHFEKGLLDAFVLMRRAQDPRVPLTLFYAFKQAESSDHGVASTGWETMLQGLVDSGFQVTATWPMRTEGATRLRAIGSNALASSVVLACRPRPHEASLATRKEFLAALRAELPEALRHLQRGRVAPVDLAQAAIGPGMAVFSRYSKVIEADGSHMPVREALLVVNSILDETLSEQESEFDPSTRWALAWFESHGNGDGPYGEAEVLSKAKDTSVSALAQDGFLLAKAGRVRLLASQELHMARDPSAGERLSVWEVTHRLMRAHQDPESGSEQAAADLLRRVGHGYGEVARDLAYRLYSISERKGWAREALAYNSLVVAWPEITRLAAAEAAEQTSLEV